MEILEYFLENAGYLIVLVVFFRGINIYIIQQNNTAPNVKDNKSFTFVINKETLKNIAIFIAGIICGYLAYRAYRRLALENSQDCIKN